MGNVYLILGSNMGNKAEYIELALLELEKNVGKLLQESSLYETEPWGMPDSEVFLNRVAVFQSDLKPIDILLKCLEIEKNHGRIRNASVYEQRTLDIDVLFIDDLVLKTSELQIPHPKIAERRFVLKPLAEICPEFIHPVLKKSILQLLNMCSDNLTVQRVF
jgi:2-amino-4-hydroxy-6-hydroxymethyldihydropteridine diphosphokinase